MFCGIIFLLKQKLEFKFIDFKLKKELVKQIYKVGFPTIILESVTAFVTMILNKIFEVILPVAVPIWGVYGKVQGFLFKIIYGLNNGMIPIIGYNFGAKRYDRIKEAVRVFLISSECIMFVGMIIFLAFSNMFLKMFSSNEEVLKYGNVALRVLSLSFMLPGISIILSGVFQAIGEGKYSLTIFFLRQLSVNLPLLYVIGRFVNVNLMWSAFILSEFLAMTVSLKFMKKVKNKYNLEI